MQHFKDVFPIGILEFPPRREVNFYIKLMPRVAPASKESYKMSTLEVVEWKLFLKEILEKGYIRPSVSPWGAPVVFLKKNDDTLRLCIDYR